MLGQLRVSIAFWLRSDSRAKFSTAFKFHFDIRGSHSEVVAPNLLDCDTASLS